MYDECEIAECHREPTTDITATDREGTPDMLVVCQPCANAWNLGRKDPAAQEES